VRAEGVADFLGQGGALEFFEVPACSDQIARIIPDVVTKDYLEQVHQIFSYVSSSPLLYQCIAERSQYALLLFDATTYLLTIPKS
jgi:hypothetical protein